MSKLTVAELKELTDDLANGTIDQATHDELVGAENTTVLPAIVKKNGKGELKTAYFDVELSGAVLPPLEQKYRAAEKAASDAREAIVKACVGKLGNADVVKQLLAKHPNHELIVVTNFGRLAYAVVPKTKARSKTTALKIA